MNYLLVIVSILLPGYNSAVYCLCSSCSHFHDPNLDIVLQNYIQKTAPPAYIPSQQCCMKYLLQNQQVPSIHHVKFACSYGTLHHSFIAWCVRVHMDCILEQVIQNRFTNESVLHHQLFLRFLTFRGLMLVCPTGSIFHLVIKLQWSCNGPALPLPQTFLLYYSNSHVE